ncbi:hypothetical protein [Vibrio parahaemolyticus]|uniref:hypothetical protein n=1 Tax=Vibrio parahaemolyticus TaxID=670 RepID=UPI00235F064F|nr:hypothetical protein [Vibrio parahaemolyticus]
MKKTRKNVDNKFTKETLIDLYSNENVYSSLSFHEMVDHKFIDIIRGSTGQLSSTYRPSSYRVFQLLRTLNEINFDTVSEKLNPRRMVLDDKKYSDSYIHQWVSCLACASQGIYHYLYHSRFLSKLANS